MSVASSYCIYYQAHIERELCWFLTATLRSYDHMVFDRTLDPETSLFEFFVAPLAEHYFLDVMTALKQEGIVLDFKKMPNRLFDSTQEV